jgi:hypothetical protein
MSAPACVTCLITKESSRLHITTLFAIGFPSRYFNAGAEDIAVSVLFCVSCALKKHRSTLPSVDGGGPVF